MTGQTPPPDPYRSVAEQYVKLVLAVGQHDGDYVDAFYGPPEWRKEAEGAKKPLATIDAQAAATEAQLAALPLPPAKGPDAELWTLRRQYLDPPAGRDAIADRHAARQEVHLRRGVAGAV